MRLQPAPVANAIYQPPVTGRAMTSSRAIAMTRSPAGPDAPTDDTALLTALAAGDHAVSASDRFGRIDVALRAAFAQLTSAACLRLAQRLRDPRPTDLVATGFARLAGERKAALLAHLLCPKRRAALPR